MNFSPHHIPGHRAERLSEETQVWIGGYQMETNVTTKAVLLASNAVDAGNTPTTTIRGGNVIVARAADGKGVPWSTTVDGEILGVIPFHTSTLNEVGVVVDKWVPLLTSGKLKTAELINGNRFLYSRLVAVGFTLDDQRSQATASMNQLAPFDMVAGNVTATVDDHGTLYMVNAVTPRSVTLPAVTEGLVFEIMTKHDGVTQPVGTFVGSANILDDANDNSTTASVTGGGGHMRITGVRWSDGLFWVVDDLGTIAPAFA